MKKNLLLFKFLIITASLFAQAPLNYQTDQKYNSSLIKAAKPVNNASLFKPKTAEEGSRSMNYYWLNFSDAVDYALNGWTLENLSAVPLWPDSNAVVTGGADGTFSWYGHAYAHMFDPISDYISDFVDDNFTVIGDAADWFNEDHSYEVDSVRFYYYYDRFNDGYTDTLKVYMLAPNSSVYQEGYYIDNDANGDYDEGIDISLFLAKYQYQNNRPNGTYTEYTFLLDNEDTASYNVASITIPLTYVINKNSPDHFVGMAWQFKPGQPYGMGDTLLDVSDPPLPVYNPLNRFWLLTNEELLSAAPVSWAEYSDNQDGFATTEVRYNISDGGWNGFYISTLAYVDEFVFEHAYVDWYVAPKGANFLATTPSPCVSLQKDFTDLSNFAAVPDDATYYWEFGDGAVSTERNPSHIYPMPGTYEVCLAVDYGGEAFDYCKNVSVSYCTGIEEITGLTDFSIFPNPADNVLNLSLNFSDATDARIEIVNVAGQTVYTEHTGISSSYNKAIDISKLPSGIYLTRISSGNQANVKNFVKE